MLRYFIQSSLKFVFMGPIDNKSAFVQLMAWGRTGDKPLPETMVTQFTDTYMRQLICGTRGRWVKSLAPGWFQQNFR